MHFSNHYPFNVGDSSDIDDDECKTEVEPTIVSGVEVQLKEVADGKFRSGICFVLLFYYEAIVMNLSEGHSSS